MHYQQDKNSASQYRSSNEAGDSLTADSQALQEIISMLKHPFQTSCDSCGGLGFIRSGQDCPRCDGSGKVLDNYFS